MPHLPMAAQRGVRAETHPGCRLLGSALCPPLPASLCGRSSGAQGTCSEPWAVPRGHTQAPLGRDAGHARETPFLLGRGPRILSPGFGKLWWDRTELTGLALGL